MASPQNRTRWCVEELAAVVRVQLAHGERQPRPAPGGRPASIARWLRPSTATRSLQPVATSTSCSVCTYSPSVTGPLWWTRSTSKCPGAGLVPGDPPHRHRARRRVDRVGPLGAPAAAAGGVSWHEARQAPLHAGPADPPQLPLQRRPAGAAPRGAPAAGPWTPARASAARRRRSPALSQITRRASSTGGRRRAPAAAAAAAGSSPGPRDSSRTRLRRCSPVTAAISSSSRPRPARPAAQYRPCIRLKYFRRSASVISLVVRHPPQSHSHLSEPWPRRSHSG